MKIVDTDVIIWYMRGNEKAAVILENLTNIMLSAVTYKVTLHSSTLIFF